VARFTGEVYCEGDRGGAEEVSSESDAIPWGERDVGNCQRVVEYFLGYRQAALI
jgi:hypothetical protein